MDDILPVDVFYDERYFANAKYFAKAKSGKSIRSKQRPALPQALRAFGDIVLIMKQAGWKSPHPNNSGKSAENKYQSLHELAEAAEKNQEVRKMSKPKIKPEDLYLHWWSMLYFEEHARKYNITREKKEFLKNRQHSFGWCHRLDVGTTGLMLLALTKEAYDYMRNEWHQQNVFRKYMCLAVGKIDWHSFLFMAGIKVDNVNIGGKGKGKGKGYSKSSVDQREGKNAQTFVEAIAHYEYEGKIYTLATCEIFTGLTHQIRCHMAGLGYPLVGDVNYQPGGRKNGGEGLWLNRPFLHSVAKMIPLPNGEHIVALATPPADLIDMLKRMKFVGRGCNDPSSEKILPRPLRVKFPSEEHEAEGFTGGITADLPWFLEHGADCYIPVEGPRDDAVELLFSFRSHITMDMRGVNDVCTKVKQGCGTEMDNIMDSFLVAAYDPGKASTEEKEGSPRRRVRDRSASGRSDRGDRERGGQKRRSSSVPYARAHRARERGPSRGRGAPVRSSPRFVRHQHQHTAKESTPSTPQRSPRHVDSTPSREEEKKSSSSFRLGIRSRIPPKERWSRLSFHKSHTRDRIYPPKERWSRLSFQHKSNRLHSMLPRYRDTALRRDGRSWAYRGQGRDMIGHRGRHRQKEVLRTGSSKRGNI